MTGPLRTAAWLFPVVTPPRLCRTLQGSCELPLGNRLLFHCQGFTGGNLLPRDVCSMLEIAEEHEFNQCYISLAMYFALLLLAVHFKPVVIFA